MNGRTLNKKWKVGVKHGLYRVTGDWYHKLNKFPGALFDTYGYVIFETEKEFDSSKYLQIKNDVHVPTGISTIPNYVQVIIDGKEIVPQVSQVKEPKSYFEGTIKETTLSIYERNRTARLLCIEHYGNYCQVCQIDFGEFYGDIGSGFIHVHHLRQISKIGNSYKVNPIEDLIPVCPNCHNMIHIAEPPLSIEQLRQKLK